jgi:hypothetical protein
MSKLVNYQNVSSTIPKYDTFKGYSTNGTTSSTLLSITGKGYLKNCVVKMGASITATSKFEIWIDGVLKHKINPSANQGFGSGVVHTSMVKSYNAVSSTYTTAIDLTELIQNYTGYNGSNSPYISACDNVINSYTSSGISGIKFNDTPIYFNTSLEIKYVFTTGDTGGQGNYYTTYWNGGVEI